MGDRSPPLPPMPGHLPSSFDSDEEFFNERPRQKLLRKIKEEPLVPLGIGLTVFAFVNAYRALRRGDSRQANRMFRARVAAQGFTVIAMVAGSMYYSKDREKTKELRKLKEEKDSVEKRQRWIRELEVRDEEDKNRRAALERRRQSATAETPAPAEAAAIAAQDGTDEEIEQGTGGILGRMGLWSKGQEKAEQDVAAKPVVVGGSLDEGEKRSKRENPKSSLGAIGEVFSKDKDDGSKKK